jgi:hypothetical protein
VLHSFLTRRLFLTVAALLLAVAPLAAAPASAQKAWAYNHGAFRATRDTTWVEKNPTGEFHFREVVRNTQYVELHDASRKMTVRLYSKTMYWKTPDKKQWSYMYQGRWVDTEKKPLDEDRLPGERSRLEAPAERQAFPHLGREYEVLGPATKTYNCIAWSIGVQSSWVWPGEKVSDFDRLYGQNGYKRISKLDYGHQGNVDKIVLYGKKKSDGSWAATHGARQLSDGSWSSKLGQLPLIRHLEPDDLDGDSYGVPIAVYVRPHRG